MNTDKYVCPGHRTFFALIFSTISLRCFGETVFSRRSKPTTMKNLILFLFLGLFVTACGEDTTAAAEKATMEATEAAQEKAYESLMEAHDRVMPLMGNITAAQKSIDEELKGDGITDSRKYILEAANEQLEDAGDKMMAWMGSMKSLDELRADMDNEAVMTYIREEAADIAKVESSMVAAIAAGKELVGGTHDHSGDDHSHDGHDHKH